MAKPMRALSRGSFVVSREGQDVRSPNRAYDAHVRIEGRRINADVFDSTIRGNLGYIESAEFPLSPNGAKEAMDFLRGYRIRVTIKLPKSREHTVRRE